MVLQSKGYNFDQFKSAGLHEKHIYNNKVMTIHVLFVFFYTCRDNGYALSYEKIGQKYGH
jgi:hypothetical protein